jgi:IS30 family transposase
MGHRKKYHHLTSSEREEISRLLSNGKTYESIGRTLHRHPSTIGREVSRNGLTPETYREHRATIQTTHRRSRQGRKQKLSINEELKRYVYQKLQRRWSPEQIVNGLKIAYPDNTAMRLSAETIYTHIYVLPRGTLKRELRKYLRQQHGYRWRRTAGRTVETRGQLRDMISISERPQEVEDRIIPGHWEGDIILGKWKKTALGTLVERTTRTTILVPLTSYDAVTVRKAFVRELKTIPRQMRLSLTYDQGKEMADHVMLSKKTKMKVYFAHPGCPWERGTNENTNGLIRQFFPKGTDFSTVSRLQVKQVQRLLNERPRKALDYRTPYESFQQLVNHCN